MTRTALVTGAGRRLGAAIAGGLAADGYFVMLHYHRSEAAAAEVAAGIAEQGGQCCLVHADLANRRAVASLLDTCTARHGLPDLLVNNASSYQYDTAATVEAEGWDANLATNLEAPLMLAGALFRALRPRSGAVVNMLDFKVTSLNPDYFSYTVAKAGLAAATRMMAMAFKGVVRVNGVAPGLTMRSGRQSEQQFERAWAMTPLGRGPTQAEIVDAVRFAATMPCLNGQILTLDGGAGLRPRDRDISVDESVLAGAAPGRADQVAAP